MESAPHKRTTHKTQPGRVLSTDITGTITPTAELGEKYIARFTEVASKYSFVMPLRRKSDIYDAIETAIQ